MSGAPKGQEPAADPRDGGGKLVRFGEKPGPVGGPPATGAASPPDSVAPPPVAELSAEYSEEYQGGTPNAVPAVIIRPAEMPPAPDGLPRHATLLPERRRKRRPESTTGLGMGWGDAPQGDDAAGNEASAYTGKASGQQAPRPRTISRLVSFGASRRGLGVRLLRRWAMALVGILAALPLVAIIPPPPGPSPAEHLHWIGAVGAIALAFAVLAGLLGRRGWGGGSTLLALLGLAAGPVAFAVANGGLGLLGGAAILFVLGLMLDRVEAVGDGRSMMGLGLALAALLALAPGLAPLGLLALALLPTANRQMRNLEAATALFATVLLPVAMLAITLALLAPVRLELVLAPLGHPGVATAQLLPWLRSNPAAPLLTMGAFLAMVPALLMVLLRLRRQGSERARPVTALFALSIGPVALLADAMLMRHGALLSAAAVALAGLFAWVVSTPLRRAQRIGLALWLWVGAGLGWALLLLSQGSAMRSLLGFL